MRRLDREIRARHGHRGKAKCSACGAFLTGSERYTAAGAIVCEHRPRR